MTNTKYRTIYIVECISDEGTLVYRLYAANRRTAERIARKQATPPTRLCKIAKADHQYIDPMWVERL